jgi:predicted tellurium resistance membrane protein TerC
MPLAVVDSRFRESVAWSLGWLLLGLAMALPMWAIDNGAGAVNYVTVYLIERTLSLDNLFVFLALMGLRALFSLVEELVRRFRYLDETIAVVLGMVGVKLLVEDLYAVGPIASLVIVLVAFAIGISASMLGDRRDPEGAAERRAAA